MGVLLPTGVFRREVRRGGGMFPRVLFRSSFRIQTNSLLLAGAVFLVGFASTAVAQESSGGVSGYVTDQLGDALSATVHLVQNLSLIHI